MRYMYRLVAFIDLDRKDMSWFKPLPLCPAYFHIKVLKPSCKQWANEGIPPIKSEYDMSFPESSPASTPENIRWRIRSKCLLPDKISRLEFGVVSIWLATMRQQGSMWIHTMIRLRGARPGSWSRKLLMEVLSYVGAVRRLSADNSDCQTSVISDWRC